MMTIEERLTLFMELKRKKIKQFQIAEHLQVSNSAVSQFFTKNEPSISQDKIEQMIEFVKGYVKEVK